MKEKFPITGILGLLEKEDNFVFLESAKCDAENFLSYVFLRSKKTISTCKIDEIKGCFAELDEALKAGCYVAGFLSYEAGEAFEERLRHREAYNFPLLWFGVYKEPLIYNHRKAGFERCSRNTSPFIKKIISGNGYKPKGCLLKNIRPNISQSSYLKAAARIKSLIARGFTYQVNYTFKLKFAFSGSPSALYLNLRDNQAVAYSSFIKYKKGPGPFYILSFSPELFFKKSGDEICVRPMKGTAKRGRDLKEDGEIAGQLKNCLKNRSENVMIVDLLRNDLGRISSTGSVRVPRLFNVENYETLFQMTSDIESRLKRRNLAFDIFSRIFPSGSVTGAPKIKTMEIIKKLEKEPRNIYTGSIGFFSPKEFGTFNVAIRTLLIDSRKETGEMGVGSGIVYDSDPKSEYAECRLKTNFLVKRRQNFQLIETMLWQSPKRLPENCHCEEAEGRRSNPKKRLLRSLRSLAMTNNGFPATYKGYVLINEHLRRLQNSAGYFNFLYNKKDVLTALRRLERGFKQSAYRVRLLLFKDGSVELKPSLFELQKDCRPKVYFSAKRTQSQDSFLYHKTTERKIYDEEYTRCRRAGFYDVIFANEKGEITEGAISNIFIGKNGFFYTPPLSCGLLDGVYRRYLLNSKKRRIKEKVLFKEDLLRAEEVYLSNSVRGLVRVRLERKSH